jgi:hypothetical protein
MKLYTLSECYTPNERDAEGYVSDVFLYKSKYEAVEKMKDLIYCNTEETVLFKDNVIIHNADPSKPSGVTVARAKATDYSNGIYEWEIREYEIK